MTCSGWRRTARGGWVLDLGASDQFTEQLITVIAAARRQLPEGCLMEVRSARPAVCNLLELAGWTGVRVSADRPEAKRRGE